MRGVAQERVESDFCRSRVRGALGIVDVVNLRGQRERALACARTSADDVDGGNRFLDALGVRCLARRGRPVPAPHQLLDCRLPNAIELANWQEEVVVQSTIVDLGKSERRLAEPPELFAERGAMQGAIRGRNELRLAASLDFIVGRSE